MAVMEPQSEFRETLAVIREVIATMQEATWLMVGLLIIIFIFTYIRAADAVLQHANTFMK